MNLDTKAGVLAYAERRRAEMARRFERVGRFEDHGNRFCAVLFGTHELVKPSSGAADPDRWRTGERLPSARAIDVHLPDILPIRMLDPVQQKDAFAYLVKEYAKKVKAIGVIFMSEMWWAKMGTRGMTKEDAKAERAKRPESLEDWDDRKEGLFMQLEHAATGNRIWFNEIKRSPTRLEGWQDEQIDDSEGRFVGLVGWQS